MPYKDPEIKKAKDREYAAAHKGEAAARSKAWRLANPERVAELEARKDKGRKRVYFRSYYERHMHDRIWRVA